MAFGDLPRVVGNLTTESISTEKIKVEWNYRLLDDHSSTRVEESDDHSLTRVEGRDDHSFTRVKGTGDTKMDRRSRDFIFAGASWNFYASFDLNKTRSQFQINVLQCHSNDEVYDCCFDISFVNIKCKVMKVIKHEYKFVLQRCQRSHWAVTDFLTIDELKEILRASEEVICTIHIKNLYETGSIENIHSSWRSSVEAPTQNRLPEKADELSVPGFDYKVRQDLKNLLLSGEGSDVILQVEDHQFKAHRSILTARSSVFAALFSHDMKEKTTGIVNIEDCEFSSFPYFLEYLYCGSTEKLYSEHVFNLYVSADRYDVPDLKRKCLEIMGSNISLNNFCETLQIAFQHSETDLLNSATVFFVRNLLLILSTTEWENFLSENPIQANKLFIDAAKICKPEGFDLMIYEGSLDP